jgi:hypothetical protein
MNIPHQSPPVVRGETHYPVADIKDTKDARGVHPQQCDCVDNEWWCWFGGRDYVNTHIGPCP